MNIVTLSLVFLINLNKPLLKPLISLIVFKVTKNVIQPIHNLRPKLRIKGVGEVLSNLGGDLLAKLFIVHLAPREPDNCEFRSEEFLLGEVIQRRDKLALGEVTSRSKNHHHTRRRWISRLPFLRLLGAT